MKFVMLILIFFSQCAFAVISNPEKQLSDYVLKNNAAQLKLLRSLVNINSGTSNIAGVMRVGKIVERQLKQLGFKTRWVAEPANMKRAPTLIAERHGNKGNRLLLIGHLDTVFAADSPFKTFELKKSIAQGPGVVDDKGGLVVLLYALKAMNNIHALDGANITVVLTGDEEDSGKPSHISRQPLISAAQNKDVALDFEPSTTLDTISISRRGIASWNIESHGNESHSATIFVKDVGDGAIFELARILNRMHDEFKGEKYLSFNPGITVAGNAMTYDKKSSRGTAFGKDNVVAKIALAHGDYRFLSLEQKKKFEDKLSQIINDHLPGTHSQITFEDGIPAMPPTDNNMKLLEQYNTVSVDLDQGKIKPFDAGGRGAGDISFIADIVPANLVGLGPIGMGEHSRLEALDLATLPIQTQRAALLMYRLTR